MFARITKEVLLVNNGTFRGKKATLESIIDPADGGYKEQPRIPEQCIEPSDYDPDAFLLPRKCTSYRMLH